MSNRSVGLIPRIRRFLYGSKQAPRINTLTSSEAPGTEATNYAGMHKDYRWFRQDELVRRCITINAAMSTMSAGFDTVLEPVGDMDEDEKQVVREKYASVKERVDAINKQVNLDQILFISQVKRSIYGNAGWELAEIDSQGYPQWLLSLRSEKLKPEVTKTWELKGYEYEGRPNLYPPEEILYFENLQLERTTADNRGLSDVEPIREICQARLELFDDFKEIVKTVWAPYVILQANTEGMTETDETATLQNLGDAARSGKSISLNTSVTPTIVHMDVNFSGLTTLMDKLEESILRAFGTPKFLLGKPVETRATAYAELEAYVQGPIANIQRYFKRELEAKWYDLLTRLALKEMGVQGDELPVCVKHVWHPIRAADIYEMGKTVAQLYGDGMGILEQFPDIAFDMMGFDKKYLEAWKQKFQVEEQK